MPGQQMFNNNRGVSGPQHEQFNSRRGHSMRFNRPGSFDRRGGRHNRHDRPGGNRGDIGGRFKRGRGNRRGGGDQRVNKNKEDKKSDGKSDGKTDAPKEKKKLFSVPLPQDKWLRRSVDENEEEEKTKGKDYTKDSHKEKRLNTGGPHYLYFSLACIRFVHF